LFSDDSASPSPAPKEVSPVSEKRPNAFRSTSGGWVPEVALLHAWAPHSGGMLATQGPALRLGADFLTGRHQFGFSLGAQYRYPQRHVEGGVAIELESAAFRLETRYLAWGLGQGGGLGPRLGFGLDTVFSDYEA